jgi:cysteine synthase A
LCNGWLREGSTVVEASSGSTAVSEAYFSRLVGLPFLAVMPASTSREKITAIEFQGGRCHLIDDPMSIYNEAQRMADKLGGHYMDQFTYAERATDWRSNNNIAESIFEQMRLEKYPVRAGWSRVRAPVARSPRLAATYATVRGQRVSVQQMPSSRSFSSTIARAIRSCVCTKARESRVLAGHASRRLSCPR